MAIKNYKPIQVMDLGTYSIKHSVLKYNKDNDELITVSRDIYKIPNAWTGVELYMESFGQYLKDMLPKLDRKLPIRFSVSNPFAPTNLSYLTRIDKEQVNQRMKDELEKFATQEKIPADCQHNRYFEMFTKEIESKVQVITATTLCSPKYVGLMKKHLYTHGLKFGGIYPVMYTIYDAYLRMLAQKPEWKDEPIAFVDIGHLSTKVNFFFQGKLLFNKVLFYGTKNFHEELFEYCTKSGDSTLQPSDVESILQKVGFSNQSDLINQMGLDINDPAPYLKNIGETLKSIFTKISSSTNYFISALARNFTADNNAFVAVRKGASHMFVSGGIINAPHFYEKMQENFPQSTVIHLVHPWDFKGTLEQTAATIVKEETQLALREHSHFADTAFTGYLSLDSAKNQYNLVSQTDSENENFLKVLQKMPLTRWRAALVVALVLAVVNLGMGWMSKRWELEKLKKEVAVLKNATTEAASLREEMFVLKQEEHLSKSKFGFIKSHMTNYPYWPSILKKLMQKVDAEVKVNSLKFTSESPAFSMDRYKKFMETQAKEDNPWLPRKINFKVDGIALTRQAVPKLIQVLKDTGIFDIPKPPSTKFVAEVTKQGRDAKGNETIETEAAHYEFSLEGVLVLGNAI